MILSVALSQICKEMSRGTTGFRISSMAAKILESGILTTFINILVKLCIYPYIVNHVMWIALFGIQESLESSQESRNPAKIPKDSESRRRKFIVSDPLGNVACMHRLTEFHHEYIQMVGPMLCHNVPSHNLIYI